MVTNFCLYPLLQLAEEKARASAAEQTMAALLADKASLQAAILDDEQEARGC